MALNTTVVSYTAFLLLISTQQTRHIITSLLLLSLGYTKEK